MRAFILINFGMTMLLGVCSISMRAGVLTPGNILITNGEFGSPADSMFEYTTGGTRVQSFAVPTAGTHSGAEFVRGVAVSPNKDVQIFNGTFTPYLTTFTPSTGSYVHNQGVGFSVVNNDAYGKPAAFGHYVYMPDQNTSGSPASGIVRFDTMDYSSVRFASASEYYNITLGGDGLIYAVSGNVTLANAGVDVYDPISMAKIRTVVLANNVREVAVSAAGDIYTAEFDSNIYHYDSTGTLQGHLTTTATKLIDIALSLDDKIVASGDAGDVILTNTSLISATKFKVGSNPLFVSFVTPLPEPSGVAFLAMGMMGLLRRAGQRSRSGRRDKIFN